MVAWGKEPTSNLLWGGELSDISSLTDFRHPGSVIYGLTLGDLSRSSVGHALSLALPYRARAVRQWSMTTLVIDW